MAILTNIIGNLSCPKCGKEAPYNFRIETRATVRDSGDSRELVETKNFMICLKCGTDLESVHG